MIHISLNGKGSSNCVIDGLVMFLTGLTDGAFYYYYHFIIIIIINFIIKNFCFIKLFVSAYYGWVVEELLKDLQDTRTEHNQLDDPLPFKFIYTNHYTYSKNSLTLRISVRAIWLSLFKTNKHIPYLVAIVDCIHVRPLQPRAFKELATVAQELLQPKQQMFLADGYLVLGNSFPKSKNLTNLTAEPNVSHRSAI